MNKESESRGCIMMCVLVTLNIE